MLTAAFACSLSAARFAPGVPGVPRRIGDTAWTSQLPIRAERKGKQWCHGTLLPSRAMIDGVEIKPAARTDAERVLIIGHRHSLGRGQDLTFAVLKLVELASAAELKPLIVYSCSRCFVRW